MIISYEILNELSDTEGNIRGNTERSWLITADFKPITSEAVIFVEMSVFLLYWKCYYVMSEIIQKNERKFGQKRERLRRFG
jgi:hypothetical protein